MNTETVTFCEVCGLMAPEASPPPVAPPAVVWHLDVLPGGQSRAVPSTMPHCCPDKACPHYGVPADVAALPVEECRERIRQLLGLRIPMPAERGGQP